MAQRPFPRARRGRRAAAPAGDPFDLVLAADVLHLRHDVESLLALLPRLLAPCGEAWIADPGRAGADEFLAVARRPRRLASSRDPRDERVRLHRLGPFAGRGGGKRARLARVDRRTILWTLVAFFGASLLFAAANDLLRDESAALRLGVQVALLALLVGVILLAVRRSGR